MRKKNNIYRKINFFLKEEENNFKNEIKELEELSFLRIEFHFYYPKFKNSLLTDQLILTMQQKLNAFGCEIGELKDENNISYSLYRLKRRFESYKEIYNFFTKEYATFLEDAISIWSQNADSFVRVIIIDNENPPNRIPGMTFTILNFTDYKDMLLKIKNNF